MFNHQEEIIYEKWFVIGAVVFNDWHANSGETGSRN